MKLKEEKNLPLKSRRQNTPGILLAFVDMFSVDTYGRRDAGEKPQGLNEASPPSFWFERLFRSVKVPFWLGAIILAFIGPLIQLFDTEISRTDFLIEFSFLYFAVAVYMQFAAIYVGRQSEKAMDLAEAMGSGTMDRTRRKLYSTEWGLVMFVMIESLMLLSYFFHLAHFELMDILRYNLIPFTFINLISSTAVWAFFYSMKSLYTVGRKTLTLKPFAEDRTLGLRPFGSAALRLVAAYEIGVLIAAIPVFIHGNFTLESISPMGIHWHIYLAFPGFVLFFLPLISFRSQLKRAKAKELNWIGPRYAELVSALKAGKGIYVDERVVGSLSALDKVERDVQQIHIWPFDIETVTHLTSITILPLLVIVLAREITLILLHV